MNYPDFKWFTGVVEDINDPEFLGRAKVRAFGYHTDNPTLIKTEQLPWATPLQPVTSAAMNGIGQSATGLLNGSTVIGFFLDGESMQQMMILGTVAGIPQSSPDASKGFNDPNAIYPKASHLNEPDTNRLARNEKITDTIVNAKRNSEDTNVPVATPRNTNPTPTWNELTTPFNPIYPFNHVHESESGHVTEIDDTPDNERLHQYHTSGSFTEIHPDGSKVTKIIGTSQTIKILNDEIHILQNRSTTIDNGDNLKITNGNLNIVVDQGDVNLTVSNGSMNTYVNKDLNETIDGNLTRVVKGNVSNTITGNVSETIQGSQTETISGSVSETYRAGQSQSITGNKNVTASGASTVSAASKTETISGAFTISSQPFTLSASTASISASASATLNGALTTVSASGVLTLSGSVINLN